MNRIIYQTVCVIRRLFYLVIRTRLDEAETAAYKLKTRQFAGASCSDGVILSFPKSGRTWVETMLSHLYVRKLGLSKTRVLEFEEDRYTLPELPYFYFTHDYAHVTHGQWLMKERGSRRHFRRTPTLLIARDPIDIAVSMYFQQSRREENPVDGTMFDFVRYQKGGMLTAIEFLNFWAAELPRIKKHKIVRYEDLIADTVSGFGGIAEFFELGFDSTEIEEAVAFSDFGNLQKLERSGELADWRFSNGPTNDADQLKVRRGKVGGYKDYFDEAQCRELEQVVAETLNPIYGYTERE